MLRKNITINENDYKIISEYIKQNGYTFSDFLRKSALNFIKQKNDMNLLEFLNENCMKVDQKEQKEIENMNLDFNDISGKELELKDVL